MPITVPTLSTYTAEDLDYITKMNNDNASIVTALSDINADLAAQFSGTGLAFASDWYRTIASSDPLHGVLGAYSLQMVASDANKQFTLVDHPVDGQSYAVIAGTRRQVTGNLGPGDLTTLNLAAGDHTVYAGVDTLGDTSLALAFDTTETNLDLALYQFNLNILDSSGGTMTITKINRTERSMLWDNTIEQLRQEEDELLERHEPTTTSGVETGFYQLPYDARVLGAFVYGATIGAANHNIRLSNADETTEYASGVVSGVGGTTGDVYEVTTSVNNQIVFPKGSVMRMEFSVGASCFVYQMGIRVRRAFNVPTQTP